MLGFVACSFNEYPPLSRRDAAPRRERLCRPGRGRDRRRRNRRRRSIWPCAVARGDVHYVRIGARTNIQDGAVLHVTHDGEYTPGGFPLIIGDDVTVGHGAIVHACTVKDACLIGMNATVLDGVVVNATAMVGAGAVVSPGKPSAKASSGSAIRRGACGC